MGGHCKHLETVLVPVTGTAVVMVSVNGNPYVVVIRLCNRSSFSLGGLHIIPGPYVLELAEKQLGVMLG
jgi:hypothetical protein